MDFDSFESAFCFHYPFTAMKNTDVNQPATKADINGLTHRLDQHDDQFEIILKLLGEIQEDTQATRRDVRILAEKLYSDHDRRLLAQQRRLGLAM